MLDVCIGSVNYFILVLTPLDSNIFCSLRRDFNFRIINPARISSLDLKADFKLKYLFFGIYHLRDSWNRFDVVLKEGISPVNNFVFIAAPLLSNLFSLMHKDILIIVINPSFDTVIATLTLFICLSGHC